MRLKSVDRVRTTSSSKGNTNSNGTKRDREKSALLKPTKPMWDAGGNGTALQFHGVRDPACRYRKKKECLRVHACGVYPFDEFT